MVSFILTPSAPISVPCTKKGPTAIKAAIAAVTMPAVRSRLEPPGAAMKRYTQ
jgi:hypothetical protein